MKIDFLFFIGSAYGDVDADDIVHNAVLTLGAIVGIVIAVIVGIVVCCVIICCCCMKSRGAQGTVYRQPQPQTTATTVTYQQPAGYQAPPPQNYPQGQQPAGYPQNYPQGQQPGGFVVPPQQPYPMGNVPPQPAYTYGQPGNPISPSGMYTSHMT